MMHNVSSLPLTVVLKATYPFQLLVEDPRWAPVNVQSSQSVGYCAAACVTSLLCRLSLGSSRNLPALGRLRDELKRGLYGRLLFEIVV